VFGGGNYIAPMGLQPDPPSAAAADRNF